MSGFAVPALGLVGLDLCQTSHRVPSSDLLSGWSHLVGLSVWREFESGSLEVRLVSSGDIPAFLPENSQTTVFWAFDNRADFVEPSSFLFADSITNRDCLFYYHLPALCVSQPRSAIDWTNDISSYRQCQRNSISIL